MRKLLAFVFCIIILLIATNVFIGHVLSEDQVDALQKEINDLNVKLNSSINATKPLESELKRMQLQIKDIKTRIAFIEQDVETKKKTISDGYKNLEKQEKILRNAISDYYIKSSYDSPFLVLISAAKSSDVTHLLAYQKAAADQDKQIITNIALSINDLEDKKKKLEDEQTRLAAAKADLDEQSGKLDKVVAGARLYQATLSSQIAQLSAKQQEIISQRLGGLNIPRAASTAAPACIDDRTINPGFSPAFAFFTYGVPNRVGLSQYGAWGRAKANQDFTQILQAYYNFDSISDTNQSTQIHVSGNGVDWSGSLEDYVKRIYEVPDSWTDHDLAALKAQAIAARSYVLAYTNNGQGTICPTDQCQVFKTDPKGGNWDSAVNQTAGKVMIQGGNPIKAWFSSTHGGYIFASNEIGWSGTSWTKHATDTTTGSAGSFDDLKNNAYDRESPWFYCDWGARSQYNKTAWLKPDEIADIANVILLARADSSTKDHFYQTDKPHPYGGEVWDQNKVKSELRNRNITPFDTVSDVSTTDVDFGSGKTNRVSISGNGKSETFDGPEFKDWFNLRAPANIQIVGPLYNIEKR